jgi:hypothetical protein
MTPKEKAIELVYKFLRVEDNTTFYWCGYFDERLKDDDVLPHAKQCALIAVDEIINTYHSPMDDEQIEEWQQVKQEIELL